MRLVSPVVLVVLAACKNDITVAQTANVEPAASINSPTDGTAVVSGMNVDFVGTVADGNGLSDITTVTWISSVDGEIVTNGIAVPDADGITRISTVLSPGPHAITLRAIDADGAVGEDTISVSVGDAIVDPEVSINEPALFANFFLGQIVDLSASVSDPQGNVSALTVEWTAENVSSGAIETIWTGNPNGSGLVTGTWQPTVVAGYILTVTAIDPEGNSGEDQVAIDVEDQNGADLDGDGFSSNSGDCDDTNASIHPNAVEVCGDALDNDCSGVVDDKDDDNDGHVDLNCVNYTGTDPRDDCDDTSSQIYPGAGELQDSIDNDCDGFVDEDTPAFDDDGDCYCEVGPCVDSVEITCTTLTEGDCDDADPDTNPAALDFPDAGYTDANCDGLDGVETQLIFVDPVAGNNANDGLTRGSAVADLTRAYAVVSSSGRTRIALGDGNIGHSGTLQQGVSLYGGYAPQNGWSRDVNDLSLLSTTNAGFVIQNWTSPTEFQQVELRAGNTSTSGASSIALTVIDSDGLTINSSLLRAGNAGSGTSGVGGSPGGIGLLGGNGGNSQTENSGLFGVCGGPHAQPSGGAGGLTSGVTTGGRGGKGGSNDNGRPQQEDGIDGVGPGGGGGAAGTSRDGSDGDPGLQGADGTPGLPGFEIGDFSASGYAAANGTTGGVGGNGGGGGGGGGGDGGENDISCDTWGGSGGGGGGGGSGGSGGTGGTGGGASVALVLIGSSVSVIDTDLQSGNGGSGGNGGQGGSGGLGGPGGSGGGGGDPLFFDAAGKGGDGGDGGQGGRGGHGGGGGGGPSVGAVCRQGSTLTETATNYNVGSAGGGGGGLGSPGETGRSANTDGC
ncbi:MAG: putative metal-binding motif-containing protein [Alphaproteobacteria bacterium]|nr:putative metal-binding motif-containing protein [Alphaproteobacteria bacterium]